MHMDGWHTGAGGDWLMVIGIALIVLVIAVGAYLIFRATSGRPGGVATRSTAGPAAADGSALDLLDSRYASGEIEREEYLTRRADLSERSEAK